jgi:uncharacterized protein YciI
MLEYYLNSMRTLFAFSFLLIAFFSRAQQSPNPSYDSVLVKKLGGDQYGMKKYVLVILKTGPNTTEPKKNLDSLFAGHFSNMDRMVKEGLLIVAGPIGKNEKTYRGIFILNVPTIEEAKKIVETDPTVKAKVLEPELYQWYGSAALPTYLEADAKIHKYR